MGSLASEGRKETAYKRGWDGKIQGKKEQRKKKDKVSKKEKKKGSNKRGWDGKIQKKELRKERRTD